MEVAATLNFHLREWCWIAPVWRFAGHHLIGQSYCAADERGVSLPYGRSAQRDPALIRSLGK